jgi:serine/threonine-protein kinase RsbW
MSEAAGAGENEALVRVAIGPLVAPVLSRVVGMLAARAQCPVDRLDDALLVTDAIAAHAQAQTVNGHVTVRLQAGAQGLRMTVDALREGGAEALLADASLPGVGNLLERIADNVSIERDEGREAVVLLLSFTA